MSLRQSLSSVSASLVSLARVTRHLRLIRALGCREPSYESEGDGDSEDKECGEGGRHGHGGGLSAGSREWSDVLCLGAMVGRAFRGCCLFKFDSNSKSTPYSLWQYLKEFLAGP